MTVQNLDSLAALLSDQNDTAVADKHGQILFVGSSSGQAYGTLPTALQNAARYFDLKPGDGLLLNDPNSGAAHLNQPIWIVQVNAHLRVAHQFRWSCAVHLSETLQGEGLRIPPTPVIHQFQFVSDFIQALENHPQAPHGLSMCLEKELRHIHRARELLGPIEVSGKELLKKSATLWLKDFREFVPQDMQGELKTEAGLLKLKVRWTGTNMVFDWSGSQLGSNWGIAGSLVSAASVWATRNLLGPQRLVSSALLDLVQVVSPRCLQTPALTAISPGVLVLYPKLKELALRTLNRMTQKDLGKIPSLPFLQFEWPGQVFSLSADAFDRERLPASIEDVEKRYPLRLQEQLNAFVVVKAATLTWMGLQAPVTVALPQQEPEHLQAHSGSLSLTAGSTVRI